MTKDAPEICAFCQQVRPLRNSHIIPEFMYRTLYDDKHRFNSYGGGGKPVVVKEQKGTRERLLCNDCEQKFCGYEQVASDFFQGALKAFDHSGPKLAFGKGLKFSKVLVTGETAALTSSQVPTLINVEGVDYKRLKLFLLSLLWRMGASDLYPFRVVELGPHLERLRTMLLTDDPGKPGQYSCQMWLIEAFGRLLTDWQSEPRKFRYQGKTFYRLFTTGFRLEFCVSNQQLHPGEVTLYCLKEEPTYVWWVDSIHKYPDLVAELIKVGHDLNWVRRPDSPESRSNE